MVEMISESAISRQNFVRFLEKEDSAQHQWNVLQKLKNILPKKILDKSITESFITKKSLMKKGKSIMSGFFNGNETNSGKSKKRKKNDSRICEHNHDVHEAILPVESSDEFSFKFSF